MNKKEQFKRFIKKDGFYVVLFVCLCIVATVGVVATNKNANSLIEESITENTKEDSTTSKNIFDDAELVEKEKTNEEETKTSNDNKAEEKKDEVKSEASNNNEVVATSNQNTSFISPVKDGVITRGYNLEPRLNESGQSASVYKGIDIEVAEGTEVLAIGDGKVVEAGKGNSKEGCFVKVEHQNGVVGFYANLDPEIKVKEGDIVKKGASLGKVGNTIQNSPSDRVSKTYLMFHMENTKEPVDPQKYLKDIPVKE